MTTDLGKFLPMVTQFKATSKTNTIQNNNNWVVLTSLYVLPMREQE